MKKKNVKVLGFLAAAVVVSTSFAILGTGRAPEPSGDPNGPEESCDGVSCEECPTTTRRVKVPGKCCPECVALDVDTCERGRKTYGSARPDFAAEFSECQSDDECALVSFSDFCQTTCPLPLNKSKVGPVIEKLRREAKELCQTCAPAPFECPSSDGQKVACVAGRCALHAGVK